MKTVEMEKLIDELTKAGERLTTDGCQPRPTSPRARLSRGKVTVMDGPFTETKELIAGFPLAR
jgi:hypothetical protein